ncbi:MULTISPECIES: metal-sensing transcriptional repressor [unclassified Acidocella]|uniref:metal-sensing transcriptional repressor n=1 Tax=unclassified Acidocella TaxID=2648610 RepID=UPI00028CC05C|nr:MULTISPECIES: metal-sensing transcriptional repressor [unclassified Acidocella]EKM98365.1 regulator protein FrmR [Acidocella sp. MX-AZ02]WBO59268.1 metal-sensing transcriptional repressor [Acidocella sp. MX-AZ03]
MPHHPEEKRKILARIRRVQGQMTALAGALEEGAECAPILQQLAAVRGAVNGIMVSVLESHLREEFAALGDPPPEPPEPVMALLRSYLR